MALLDLQADLHLHRLADPCRKDLICLLAFAGDEEIGEEHPCQDEPFFTV